MTAGGVLEGPGVRVEVRADVERGQNLGGGQLPQRHRLHHALARQQDFGVLHAGQLQGAGEIDRLSLVVEEGSGPRRQFGGDSLGARRFLGLIGGSRGDVVRRQRCA